MAAPDVIIIGGGIVGAACCDELARAGMRTLLIEAGEIGGGATAAGMGHIVVMDDSEAQFALTDYSCRLWALLSAELPPGAEFTRSGTIWVAANEDEMAEVERKRAFYESRGVAASVLDPQALAEAEPNLRAGLAGGLLVPHDAVVYPPRVAAFLLDRARRHGARLSQAARVTAISGKSISLSNGDRIEAAVIVNATGAAAPALSPQAPIQPRKGHLLITACYPNFVRHQLVELGYLNSAHAVSADSVAFNLQPRKTGQLLIGSSRQFGSTDPRIEQRMMAWMLERAVQYVPAVARLSAIRGWTGFRACTPDNLPLIGPAGGNVWLAAGHEGLGITTSLGTANLLADQILNRNPSIPFEPYLPNRKAAAHV